MVYDGMVKMIKFIVVKYQQKNGKIINRRMWTDDNLSWYWVGSRKHV